MSVCLLINSYIHHDWYQAILLADILLVLLTGCLLLCFSCFLLFFSSNFANFCNCCLLFTTPSINAVMNLSSSIRTIDFLLSFLLIVATNNFNLTAETMNNFLVFSWCWRNCVKTESLTYQIFNKSIFCMSTNLLHWLIHQQP